ncbi:MAG: ABC transporter ATP-binding protein [Acidimicrobiia bacterium]
MWRHARGRLGALVLGLTAVVLSAATVAIGPTALRIAIDDGVRAGDQRTLAWAGAAYLAIGVLGGIVDAIRTVSAATVGQHLVHHLRSDAVGGVLGLELAQYEAADRGDLQARVTSDADSLGGAAEGLAPNLLEHLIAIVGGFAAVALLSLPLALVALVFVPPATLAGWWLLRRGREVYPAMFRANAAAVGAVVELTEGSTTIASFGAGPRRLAGLRAISTSAIGAAMRAAAMHNWFYSTLLALQAVATASVVVGAGLLVDRGSITIGTGTAAVLVLAGVFGPVSWFLAGFDDMLRARTALVRVGELAALADSAPAGAPGLPRRGELVFDDAGYAYLPGTPALAGIDLTVAPGERVAVVGATGSGKSTLARLAVGLAVPSTGTVHLGGSDVGTAGAIERARRLTLVTQETFLVEGTILDNVRLARPILTDDEVRAAADRLGLGAWIAGLPEGVDTPVGPNGSQLSLGERQLVALLRAVVGDPAVLVLDEATSILDPATEAAVAVAVERAGADRVVLVIAHRLATAARCDRVVVLSGGRIVEVGRPADLAVRDGQYARLFSGTGIGGPSFEDSGGPSSRLPGSRWE